MYCATCGSSNSSESVACSKCGRALSARPSTMVGVAPQAGISSAPPAAVSTEALPDVTTFDPTMFEAAQAAMAQPFEPIAERVAAPLVAAAAPLRAVKGTMLGMASFVTPAVGASARAAASAPAEVAAPSSKRIGGTMGLVVPTAAMINANRAPLGYPGSAATPAGVSVARSPWLVVILGAVTFGVFYLYWLNSVAQQLASARKRDEPNAIKLVLLSLATLGIYSWIWRGADAGRQIAEAQASLAVTPAVDLGIVALIPFYGVYAMQRELNRLV